jgi:hypothetical protein
VFYGVKKAHLPLCILLCRAGRVDLIRLDILDSVAIFIPDFANNVWHFMKAFIFESFRG